MENTTCKVCDQVSESIGTARVLNKYDIDYFVCKSCGFIQTEKPYWLDEAYGSAINLSDTGIISRNLWLSRVITSIIVFFFDRKAKFLDYAGGYGIFTRMMRDIGFDYYWDDAMCANLTARGFECAEGTKFEMITAFEVFEHLVDPVSEVEKMLAHGESICFSTELYHKDQRPGFEEWWYFGLEHGQHVALYTYESLQVLAAKFGMNLCSDKKGLHLMTRKKVNPALFFLIVKLSNQYLLPLSWLFKRRTMSDMVLVKERLKLK